MKRTYTDPIMLRLSTDMRARVAEIAHEEGNSETAVLRRLIAAGLDVVRPRPTAQSIVVHAAQ